MSRAAFIMDRALRRFGLSGKAFIPMLMGFGCSVPAIMGARTMENEKDRRMTILLIPFMSCSAKLPVYGLISAAFFGPWAGLVVFSLYMIGILVGILSGLFFKKALFPGEPAPFVLELPPYRLPSLGNMMTHVWQKVKGFLVKAGTLILLMSVVLWLLQSFDFSLRMVSDAGDSMLGTIGALIAPVFAPLGFGFWQAAVALLTGFVAKEMVVSSLSHVLWLLPHRRRRGGGRRHDRLHPPGRLLHAGVHPAVRPLCGGHLHHGQGAGQRQVGLPSRWSGRSAWPMRRRSSSTPSGCCWGWGKIRCGGDGGWGCFAASGWPQAAPTTILRPFAPFQIAQGAPPKIPHSQWSIFNS